MNRRRLSQTNYRAMQPVPQIRVGKLGVQAACMDADAQVDVSFADLDDVDAGTQLADQRLGLGPLDVELGGKFDQRFGREPARARGKAQHPREAKGCRQSHVRFLVLSCAAAAYAHSSYPPGIGANVYRHLRPVAIASRKSRQGL